MGIDLTNVGQGKTHGDPTCAYDAEHGTYKDPVESIPEDDKLPTKAMPKAPDPSPFTVGPQAPGGRSE